MTIAFWALAALMTLLALAFIVLPVLRRPEEGTLSEGDSNLAILRARVRELAAERDAGVLSQSAYEEARRELERDLLQQLPSAAPAKREGGRWVVWVAVLLVPLVAIPVYRQLGAGEHLEVAAAPAIPTERREQVEFIRHNIEALVQRMRTDPNAEPEGWVMLGRSYMILQRFEEAAAAYAEARSRLGEHPALLTDYAEALAYAQDNRLIGEPRALLERALELEPQFPKAQWLAGLAAVQAGETERAKTLWQSLAAQLPPGSEAAAEVNAMLVQIGAEPATAAPVSAGPRLKVSISLDPQLAARVAPDDTVFVVVRAVDGPRAPLAAQRRVVKDLPLQIELDDSMAMVEGMEISKFPKVVVEARVTRSGNATTASGDLRGHSTPVVTGQDADVAITIDEVVP